MAKVSLEKMELGTSEFAKMIGKSPQWVRQLTRDGILTQCAPGKYRFGESVVAYIEHASGGKVGDDKQSHADVKAEHELLKKKLTELKLQEQHDRLHEADVVRVLMNEMIHRAKNKFLSLPLRVSPHLEGESAKNIEKKLKEEIDNVLMELANYSPEQIKAEQTTA